MTSIRAVLHRDLITTESGPDRCTHFWLCLRPVVPSGAQLSRSGLSCRYAVKVDMNNTAAAGSSGASNRAGSGAAADGRDTDYSYAASTGAASTSSTSSTSERGSYSGSAGREPAVEVVEADAIIVPARQDQSGQGGGDGSSGSGTRRDEYFRVVIRDKASGYVKLETKIPAGFMAGIRAIVPQVGATASVARICMVPLHSCAVWYCVRMGPSGHPGNARYCHTKWHIGTWHLLLTCSSCMHTPGLHS
jgi:hypothetical protein